ncbi:MAG: tyrosine-type recombinase/integrase [Crocinitomicaceae bacterium]
MKTKQKKPVTGKFYTFLVNQGLSLTTVNKMNNIARAYLDWKTSNTHSYDEVINYVKYCQSLGNVARTINQKIKALDYYFQYINHPENPAKQIKIKGSVRKIPTKLLNQEELDELYSLLPTNGLINKRNKILMSLVIYQGVGSTELSKIEVTDLDLAKGKIYVPSTKTTNSRTLDLTVEQALGLQDYLLKIRPILHQEYQVQDTGKLLITLGKGNQVNGLSNVIIVILRKVRLVYPRLQNLQQIRQSVITNWIKNEGLRQAQYKAGHKYVSSTERYQEDKFEGLKKELNQFHPL